MSANSLREAFGRMLRPAVGFRRPSDVLKDDALAPDDKKAILASWASDACAVQGKPYLRWALGTEDPVPLNEVLEALKRAEAAGPPIERGLNPSRARARTSGPRLA